jgi:alkanesulfonate monooxygenase SsuD/methylene tetrahydromethanopterin reductase-like flavin-dependent oxidoreductase (luciferase family)
MATSDVQRPLAGLGLVLGAPNGHEPEAEVLARATAMAETVEHLGWSSLWVEEPSADPPDSVPYEAYSFLAAVAARTGRIHLGVAAAGAQRRPPSILAKIVTGVDVISRGRSVLSLDGDTERDSDVDRLSEALEVCRAILEDGHPTFEGRIYHVDGAVNHPAPVQAGGVPLVVFLEDSGPDLSALLEVCGPAADAVVVDGDPDGLRRVRAAIDGDHAARTRPGERALVLARIAGGAADSASAVARARDAGADGCLVTVPAPWSQTGLEALTF